MAPYSHNHSFMQSFSLYYYGYQEEEEVVKHGEEEEEEEEEHLPAPSNDISSSPHVSAPPSSPLCLTFDNLRFAVGDYLAWDEKPSTPTTPSYPTSSSSDDNDNGNGSAAAADDDDEEEENDDGVDGFQFSRAFPDYEHISMQPPAPSLPRQCANESVEEAGGGGAQGNLPGHGISPSPHVIAPPSPSWLTFDNLKLEVGDGYTWVEKRSSLKTPSYLNSDNDDDDNGIDEFEFSRTFSDYEHMSMSPASLPLQCTDESIGRGGGEGNIPGHSISSSPYASFSSSQNCLTFDEHRHKVGDGFTWAEKKPSTPKAPSYPSSDDNDNYDDGVDKFEFSRAFSDYKHISMSPVFVPRRCTNGSLGGQGEGHSPRFSKSSSPYASALSSPASYHAFGNLRFKVGDDFSTWGEKLSTPKSPSYPTSHDDDNGEDSAEEFEFSRAFSDCEHISMSPAPLPRRCTTKDSLGGLYAKANVNFGLRPSGPLPLPLSKASTNVPNDCCTHLSSGFLLRSSPCFHSLIKDVLLCGRDLYDIGGNLDSFHGTGAEHLAKDGKGGHNRAQSALSQCRKGSDLGSESFASCRSSRFLQEVMECGEGIGEIPPKSPFVKKATTTKKNKKKKRPLSSKKWTNIRELFSRSLRASTAVTSSKGNSGQQILLQGDDDATSSSSELSSCLVCASSSLTSSSSLSSSSSSFVSLASSARAREAPNRSTLATMKERQRKSIQRHTSSTSVSVSAHEVLYTSQRLQSQAAQKKTTLPYRGGLLGCHGFVPSTHTFRTTYMAKTM